MPLISTKPLRGFRDHLPEMMMPREALIEIARQVYRSYGFSPIDTPALEMLEVLSGQGSDETDKQMFRFEDSGGRQVGMRFDLTVPLARFAAEHAQQLGLPFKRYHIASVWRGERPQRGRYREFMQCDFDTIGTTSVVADVETALVIHDLMRKIGFEDFTIRVNNRRVLNGLLESFGLLEKSVEVLRAIDKLEKAGRDSVIKELDQAGIGAEQAGSILELSELQGSNQDILARLAQQLKDNENGTTGVSELETLLNETSSLGIQESHLKLDVGIARGLDYYTGTVFETTLNQLPGIGSVCSGGRYDNLTAKFTKQVLPGIGASLGLDRLLAAQEELGMVEKTRTPAPVLIAYFEKDRLSDYLNIAQLLRATGIGVTVYPECKKLDKQLKYADRLGFRYAVIIGERDFAANLCQLKDLQKHEQQELPIEDDMNSLIESLHSSLS